MAVNQRADETVRLAMPENIRKLPEAPAALLPWLRPRGLGHREHERVEDARAGRVARKGGRDHAVDQEDAVAQAEGRPPERAHHEVAQALAEPALHDGARHEEGHDDEQDRAVGEARVGLRRRERPGQHGRGQGEHGGGQDGKRADHHRDDRRHEQGEEVPRLGDEAFRHRGEPEAEDEGQDGGPSDEPFRSDVHGWLALAVAPVPRGAPRGPGWRRPRPRERTST